MKKLLIALVPLLALTPLTEPLAISWRLMQMMSTISTTF